MIDQLRNPPNDQQNRPEAVEVMPEAERGVEMFKKKNRAQENQK
jgi:hypothetical protein